MIDRLYVDLDACFEQEDKDTANKVVPAVPATTEFGHHVSSARKMLERFRYIVVSECENLDGDVPCSRYKFLMNKYDCGAEELGGAIEFLKDIERDYASVFKDFDIYDPNFTMRKEPVHRTRRNR